MGDFCCRMVERFGSAWGYVGWLLFCGLLFAGFAVGTGAWSLVLLIVLGVLTLLWWLVDVIDQQVALWQIGLGIVMLVIGCLPNGGLLIIACWVLYWTRVRE